MLRLGLWLKVYKDPRLGSRVSLDSGRQRKSFPEMASLQACFADTASPSPAIFPSSEHASECVPGLNSEVGSILHPAAEANDPDMNLRGPRASSHRRRMRRESSVATLFSGACAEFCHSTLVCSHRRVRRHLLVMCFGRRVLAPTVWADLSEGSCCGV